MIQINKAVLHIFDYGHKTLHLSQGVMQEDDLFALHFARKQLEKLLASPVLGHGTFESFSKILPMVNAYAEETLPLLDLSAHIARQWYDLILESDTITPAALLVMDVYDNANHYLVALKYKSKSSFFHQEMTKEGRSIQCLLENQRVIPSSVQSVEECFIIHLQTMEIAFKDKIRKVQGEDCMLIPQRLLNCTSELSFQEVMKTISSVEKDFSKTYDLDLIEIESKTNQYVQTKLEGDGYLNREELSDFVFHKDSNYAKELDVLAQQQSIPEQMRMHLKFADQKSKTQRLKTDNGIEIKLPSALYTDQDLFEIIKHEDGSMDIVLKNIKLLQV